MQRLFIYSPLNCVSLSLLITVWHWTSISIALYAFGLVSLHMICSVVTLFLYSHLYSIVSFRWFSLHRSIPCHAIKFLCSYDSDFNHSPCLKNGHKAHWALIIGCLIDDQNRVKWKINFHLAFIGVISFFIALFCHFPGLCVWTTW